jgi:hypothetical protein
MTNSSIPVYSTCGHNNLIGVYLNLIIRMYFNSNDPPLKKNSNDPNEVLYSFDIYLLKTYTKFL